MAEALPTAQFASKVLPRRARYEAWRDLVSAVFVPTLPDNHGHRDLRAQVNSINFGHALIFDVQAEAQGFVRSPRLIANEQLDHYILQVYRTGVCNGAYGDVQNIVYPGDIKVVDLTRPFHTSNTDFDNISLTIPRDFLAPLLEDPDAMHGRVLNRHSAMTRVIAAHIRELADHAADLDMADGIALASATIRLVAAGLGANKRARDETRSYQTAAIGQAVRDFIERNLTSPTLEPDLLVRQFRMSRTQLYRLFEEDGGVFAYIRLRRLPRCFQLITHPLHPGRAIGEIAFGLGFTSEAHFSRLFRRTFGLAPSEARQAGVAARMAVPASQASFINDWMRGLHRGSAAD